MTKDEVISRLRAAVEAEQFGIGTLVDLHGASIPTVYNWLNGKQPSCSNVCVLASMIKATPFEVFEAYWCGPAEVNTEDWLRAFVAGAAWWEYHQTGFPMLQSDRTIAAAAAAAAAAVNGVKIPDIAWGEIVPAGQYPLGGDAKAWDSFPQQTIRISSPYQLARYPITYAQFQRFVEAADMQDDRWWAGIPELVKDWQGREHLVREFAEQAFKFDNHPRDNVSWYQAIAFCRWLSDKLGYAVDLPTEYEWEVAARYPDGRFYPWGNEFDPAKANTAASGIRRTSAVGLFPDGANPTLGLYDLSGNVWEWCRNKYGDPADNKVDDSGETRALRGGSWYASHDLARAAYRDWDSPGHRHASYGFRVVRRGE